MDKLHFAFLNAGDPGHVGGLPGMNTLSSVMKLDVDVDVDEDDAVVVVVVAAAVKAAPMEVDDAWLSTETSVVGTIPERRAFNKYNNLLVM
jgi:hypothetical protein